jgi:hypothetical protein
VIWLLNVWILLFFIDFIIILYNSRVQLRNRN